MSQAEMLLNSLYSETTASTDDGVLVIDNYTRTITIPESVKNLGVASDDEVLRLKFKMPRYLGKIDLSEFSIRINYMNARSDGDVYKVTDATVTADYITFTWLVGPTATAYAGNVKFNVCMVIVDSESVIQQEYNTTVATLPVLEGLETYERVVSEHTDILEQWENRLFGVGDTEEANLQAVSAEEQENIAQKGIEVLATIPEDYATTFNMINNADRTKADAIICSTEGQTISVVDSSDDHIRNLRIFGKTTQVTTTGKNLLNHSLTTRTANGVVLTVANDKTVIANGISTANSILVIGSFTFRAGESYILSGCPDGGSDTTYRLDLRNDGLVEKLEYGDGVTVAFDVDTTMDVCIRLHGENTNFSNVIFRPMIRLASIEDSSYEPYTGGVSAPNPDYPQDLANIKSPVAYIYGKNLLNIVNGGEVLGITETVSNGLVNFSGTSTGSGGRTRWQRSDVIRLIPGTYYLSMVVPSGTAGTPCLTVETTSKVLCIGTGAFIVSETTDAYLGFNYDLGVTYDAQNVSIQLELGGTSTIHESYADKQTIAVDYTLPGIPVTTGGNYTDSNGQQWICDEIDFERGVYIRRIVDYDLSNVSVWAAQSGWANKTAFFCGSAVPNAQAVPGYFTKANMLCNRLTISTPDSISRSEVNAIGQGAGGGLYVSIKDITTADDLKNYFIDNQTILQCILATPVETALTAEEIQNFKALYTNFPNTTVLNDAGAWMQLKYNADTKTYLDRLPKATDEQVWAAVDRWLTAKYGAIAEEASF